jgi:hypothetical protein
LRRRDFSAGALALAGLKALGADRPSRFEWLMHVEEAVEQRAEASFLVRSGAVAMDVQFLLPDGLAAKAADRLLSAVPDPAASCLIVAVLHPRKGDAPAAIAQLDPRQDGRLGIAIAAGNRRASVSLDLTSQTVAVG